MTIFRNKILLASGALLCATLGVMTTAATANELRGWNIHVEDYPVSIAM